MVSGCICESWNYFFCYENEISKIYFRHYCPLGSPHMYRPYKCSGAKYAPGPHAYPTVIIIITEFALHCTRTYIYIYIYKVLQPCMLQRIGEVANHGFLSYWWARLLIMMTSPKWNHFPRYWPFVPGIYRDRWIPRTKVSDAELWCFLWSASE